MIYVVSVHDPLPKGARTVYIGRKETKTSIYGFGNPFIVRNEKERDLRCEQYEIYFLDRIRHNPDFRDEVGKLIELAKKGDLYLLCHCAPKRCHGDTIKRFIENTHYLRTT